MNAGLVDLFGDCDDESTTSSSGSLSHTKRRGKQKSAIDKGLSVGCVVGVLPSSDEDNGSSTTAQGASLPPEIERGNIEYKLKLIDPSPVRFEHLVTQMKWRLQEGLGEAIYEIGVSDDGYLKGLDATEMSKSLETLKRMAQRLGASMNIIREVVVEESGGEEDEENTTTKEEETNDDTNSEETVEATFDSKGRRTTTASQRIKKLLKKSPTKKKTRKTASEVLIRRVPDDSQFIDIRIAVLGNVDCGKSTLISVLTYDELDNGAGRARLNLLRHIHEIQSGRTSSISKEVMGFNDATYFVSM